MAGYDHLQKRPEDYETILEIETTAFEQGKRWSAESMDAYPTPERSQVRDIAIFIPFFVVGFLVGCAIALLVVHAL